MRQAPIVAEWPSGRVAEWMVVLAAALGAVVIQMTVASWMAIGPWAPDVLALGVLYVALRRGTRAACATGLLCGYVAAAVTAAAPWGLMGAYGAAGALCGVLRRQLYHEQTAIQVLLGGCGAGLVGLMTLPRPMGADQLYLWRSVTQMLLPVSLYTALLAPIGYAWLQRCREQSIEARSWKLGAGSKHEGLGAKTTRRQWNTDSNS